MLNFVEKIVVVEPFVHLVVNLLLACLGKLLVMVGILVVVLLAFQSMLVVLVGNRLAVVLVAFQGNLVVLMGNRLAVVENHRVVDPLAFEDNLVVEDSLVVVDMLLAEAFLVEALLDILVGSLVDIQHRMAVVAYHHQMVVVHRTVVDQDKAVDLLDMLADRLDKPVQ